MKIFLLLIAISVMGSANLCFSQNIVTVAGNGLVGSSGDLGAATNASFRSVLGICVDSKNNIYIADYTDHRVRRIDHITGVITSLAGTGIAGYSGDNGPASAAKLNTPGYLLAGKNNEIFIAERGNHCIRKVDSLGIISTYVDSTFLTIPGGMSFDVYGNLHVIDVSIGVIKKIDKATHNVTIVAGNSVVGYSGDGGPATAASIACNDIYIDRQNMCYVPDRTDGLRLRKIDLSDGSIISIAGTGTTSYNGENLSALSCNMAPYDVVVGADSNLYFSDLVNNRIRKFDRRNNQIKTIAGSSTSGYSGDGAAATAAKLYGPTCVMFDKNGDLIFSDSYNYRVRKILLGLPQETSVAFTYESNNISIYPNPTHNQLHIEGGNLQSYRLINSIGTVAQAGPLQPGHNTLPTDGLPAGVYIVEVVTAEGVSRGRVVVE